MSILCATRQYQNLVQTHADSDIVNICTNTDKAKEYFSLLEIILPPELSLNGNPALNQQLQSTVI